ncbi:MAG TPA: hypothetical protein VHL98_14200 [Microvirga sp.]|jgi:UPF0716 family protein affecting phage T7 exclusion|nr:hypothetical protein [Microvirga sp.]
MQTIVIGLVLAGVAGAAISLMRLASTRAGRGARRALLASVVWTVAVAGIWEVSKEAWARHQGFATYSDYWKASEAGYASAQDWYGATLVERARALSGVGPARASVRTATWQEDEGS